MGSSAVGGRQWAARIRSLRTVCERARAAGPSREGGAMSAAGALGNEVGARQVFENPVSDAQNDLENPPASDSVTFEDESDSPVAIDGMEQAVMRFKVGFLR